jgi:myo-inositol-1(or 4)-monophosphatase
MHNKRLISRQRTIDLTVAPAPAGGPAIDAARLLPAIVDTVHAVAAAEIMPRFLVVAHERKADGSVLTEADLAAQAALERGLRALVDCEFLAEEMTTVQHAERWLAAGQRLLWCVDPIDGTSNFAHGLPYFSVSVALMQAGRSVLGVVYDPVARETFHAAAGAGAWLDGVRLPIRSAAATLRRAMAGVDFKRLDPALAARLVEQPPYCSHRSFGSSALEWCYAAAGRFDVYLHGGQRPWDYAAGALIFEEAGGRYSGLDDEDYWQGPLWERPVVAALDPALFAEWRGWLRAQRGAGRPG